MFLKCRLVRPKVNQLRGGHCMKQAWKENLTGFKKRFCSEYFIKLHTLKPTIF